MASTTKEHAGLESPQATPVRTGPLAQTTKSAVEYFQEYGRERPESWPSGASALASH